VLRDVAEGESILVTNNGVAVARISPASETEPDLRVSRPATRHGFKGLTRHKRLTPTTEILTDLRAAH
jgi:antitoxin (DNA-binding transcriptional repressor) of toxin-antitoxin stability system